MENKKTIGLKHALNRWVSEHTSIPEFSKKTGYSYQHSWSLISSKAPITDSVIGRFALTFGAEALAELLAMVEPEHT